ncbi:hypothetical protein DB32_003548 [Sandaracinus amylolyticus]|uniref:Uncharacterized protein n=1 Tax=Sandaracinus amylolyticus TaxID=927083 RepID=A0A0F6SF64_9BACT|nr:hypothetical protein DB32_003548 [Sandaracinus amylolyticus]
MLPLLETRAPDVFDRMRRAHAEIDAMIDAFSTAIDDAPSSALYTAACQLTASYLEHTRVEELELEHRIRAVVSDAELRAIGAASVTRTPEDQRAMMTAFVLAAIPRVQVEAHLAKLPRELASSLRARVG